MEIKKQWSVTRGQPERWERAVRFQAGGEVARGRLPLVAACSTKKPEGEEKAFFAKRNGLECGQRQGHAVIWERFAVGRLEGETAVVTGRYQRYRPGYRKAISPGRVPCAHHGPPSPGTESRRDREVSRLTG